MANLYVNSSTGNDARDKATASNSATPWATIGRAAWGSTNRSATVPAEAADAGDTVFVTGSVFTATTSYTTEDPAGATARFDAWYGPINTGTAGNPIRFEAVGAVEIRNTSGRYGPLIGATGSYDNQDRSYIEWVGFTIDCANAPPVFDSAPVVFYSPGTNGASETSNWCMGCVAEDLTLTGLSNWTTGEGNNFAGIRFEYVDDITIRNCTISNFGRRTLDPDHNHAGMTWYKWRNVLMENCTISDCGSGIYVKQIDVQDPPTMGTVTIRKSIFANCYKGLHMHRAPHTSTDPLYFYQNILYDCQYAIDCLAFTDGAPTTDLTSPRFLIAVNNTLENNEDAAVLYNKAGGVVPAVGNLIEFKNNIVYGGRFHVAMYDMAGQVTTSNFAYDRNAYYSPSVAFGDINAGSVSFATWQGATYTQDANAINGTDPQFTDLAGHDYRVNNATVLALGRVVHGIGGTNGATIPAGAFITGSETIGAGAGSSPEAPPPRAIPAWANGSFSGPASQVSGSQAHRWFWVNGVATAPTTGGFPAFPRERERT